MGVSAISSPIVIRRNFAVSTTTIRETVLDLGIRPAQSELAQLLKMTISKELGAPWAGAAITSAQDNQIITQAYALSTQTGLAAIPDQKYEDGCFFYNIDQVAIAMPAAASIGMTSRSYGDGAEDGTYIPNPPIVLAANEISLYDILVDADTSGIATAFAIEFMYQLVKVDSATLAALLARGDLFI